MAVDLRRKFPSLVSPSAVFAELGVAHPPEPWTAKFYLETIACPTAGCGNRHVRLNRLARPWWLECDACGWEGDLLEYWMAMRGVGGVAEAVAALAAAGAIFPAGASRPEVLQAYHRHRAGRKAFAGLAGRMAARQLTAGSAAGPALDFAGLKDRPHEHPLWWCLTPDELDGQLGGQTEPRRGLSAELVGGGPAEARALPVVAVPCFDMLGRVGGVWVLRPEPKVTPLSLNEQRASPASAFVWRGVPGAPGGIGFLMRRSDQMYYKLTQYPIPNIAPCVVTLVPHALWLHAAAAARGHPPPAVRALPGGDWRPEDAARQLKTEAGVLWVPGWVAPATAVKVLRLARLLGWRVSTASWDPLAGREAGWLDAEARGRAAPWPLFLADLIGRSTPNESRQLLAGLGWGPGLREECRPHWTVELLQAADRAVADSRTAGWVQVAPGLTVADEPHGWVWVETGETLWKTPPVVTRVYRGGDGRVRHAGYVRADGVATVPFDTARLRKDPAAVVEAALVRAGRNVPPLHPRLADPHVLVHVALHFSGYRNARLTSEQ